MDYLHRYRTLTTNNDLTDEIKNFYLQTKPKLSLSFNNKFTYFEAFPDRVRYWEPPFMTGQFGTVKRGE